MTLALMYRLLASPGQTHTAGSEGSSGGRARRASRLPDRTWPKSCCAGAAAADTSQAVDCATVQGTVGRRDVLHVLRRQVPNAGSPWLPSLQLLQASSNGGDHVRNVRGPRWAARGHQVLAVLQVKQLTGQRSVAQEDRVDDVAVREVGHEGLQQLVLQDVWTARRLPPEQAAAFGRGRMGCFCNS